MKIKIESIGSGTPKILIIGCTHGDEIIGYKVIKELKKIKLKRGSLDFLIANELAKKNKKRFLDVDLNRAFPGKKNGNKEEKIAFQINKILKNYDLVLDIHATNSNFDVIAIVCNLDNKTKNLLKITPIKKVGLIKKKVFGGNELIFQVKHGMGLEYGPNKTGKNYKKALKDVKEILNNLDMIESKVKNKLSKQKSLYVIVGSYKVDKSFREVKSLQDFNIIKKNQIVGKDKTGPIKASESFYPIFLGKGRYNNILALISKKSKLKLK